MENQNPKLSLTFENENAIMQSYRGFKTKNEGENLN